MLNQMTAKGVTFGLGVKQIIDVEAGTKENIDVKINVVNANDVGVQLKNRKAYRVLVRPTLSRQA